MKKVYIIDSNNTDLSCLIEAISNLSTKNFGFSLLSGSQISKNLFVSNNLNQKTISKIFSIKKFWHLFIFLLISPILYFFFFTYLLFLKYSRKINTLVLLGTFEKVAFTKLGRFLRLSIIWLEFPEESFCPKNKLTNLILKNNSKKAKVITFSNKTQKQLLEKDWKKENISILPLGIKSKGLNEQENIFNKIAASESLLKKRKFFTVGTITNLNPKHLGNKMEIFFQAVKKALIIIPHMQIIIVGDGPERKNLTWLAKRMEIDNLLWLVGEQKNLKKWFDSFDIYITPINSLETKDLVLSLKAMDNGLPVIAPDNCGFETYIENQKNGILLDMEKSEFLAQELIALQQKKQKRESLCQACQKTITEKFSVDAMTNNLKKILE